MKPNIFGSVCRKKKVCQLLASPVLAERARLFFLQLYPDPEKAFTTSTGF